MSRRKRRPTEVAFNRQVPGAAADGGDDLERQVTTLERSLFDEREEKKKLAHDSQTLRHRLKVAEAEHTERDTSHKVELSKLTGRMSQVKEKLTRLTRLEGAIVDLCLEMKDRSCAGPLGGDGGDDVDRREEEAAERNELCSRTGGNPLVALDLLRANLRIQLAFKDDYESELKMSIDARRNEHKREVVRLTQRVEDASASNSRLEASRQDALERMQKAEAGKEAVVAESRSMLQAVEAEKSAMEQEISRQKNDVTILQGEISHYERRIKEQDSRMMRIAQLEDELHSNKAAFERGLNKAEVKEARVLMHHNKQLEALARTTKENVRLNDELKTMADKVRGFKQNIKLAKVAAAQQKAVHAAETVLSLRQELKTSQGALQRATANNGRQAGEIADMKVEYNKLFEAVNKFKKGKKKANKFQRPRNAAEARRRADANPYYASVYRARLKTKEEETLTLKTRLKEMLATEHRRRQYAIDAASHRRSTDNEVFELRRQAEDLRSTNEELERRGSPPPGHRRRSSGAAAAVASSGEGHERIHAHDDSRALGSDAGSVGWTSASNGWTAEQQVELGLVRPPGEEGDAWDAAKLLGGVETLEEAAARLTRLRSEGGGAEDGGVSRGGTTRKRHYRSEREPAEADSSDEADESKAFGRTKASGVDGRFVVGQQQLVEEERRLEEKDQEEQQRQQESDKRATQMGLTRGGGKTKSASTSSLGLRPKSAGRVRPSSIMSAPPAQPSNSESPAAAPNPSRQRKRPSTAGPHRKDPEKDGVAPSVVRTLGQSQSHSTVLQELQVAGRRPGAGGLRMSKPKAKQNRVAEAEARLAKALSGITMSSTGQRGHQRK